jgi:phosphoglycerate dehydrogenase-like enzyme
MTLGYMGVGTIAKRPWKLLSKLKFEILTWLRVKMKKIPCHGNP